jgi:DNA repair exonuclease SbcCD ATPase subunit
MYLKRVVIENIKCFGRAELNLMSDDEQIKHWSVILGENGTGKSTLLQAIAMALVGPEYGPFRRLLGGAPDTIRLMYPGQKEARFITLFREDAALEDLTDWLDVL